MRLEISESQKNSSRNLHTLINIWDIVLHKMRCCEIPSDVLSECFAQFSTIVLESAVDWILVKLRLRKCLEDVRRKVWWVNRRVCLAHPDTISANFVQSCVNNTTKFLTGINEAYGLPNLASDPIGSRPEGSEGALLGIIS